MINLKNRVFIDWLETKYKIKIHGSIILVYKRIDNKFEDEIPIEFRDINYEIHYPEVIITEGDNYYPGISKYDSEKEFFTIRIN